jgi:hypothetical protein
MTAWRGSGLGARATLGLFLSLAPACREKSAPTLERGRLPPGVAAIVGSESVMVGTVARIARAQGVSANEARARAIDDALFAAAARADPAEAPRVSVAERGVLARAVLEGLWDQAHALGPPSDDEVSAVTAERWPELDRPPSVRTTHAVVRVKSPADDASARALAASLAKSLADAKSADEFVSRARAFPSQGLEIRTEELPPVTTDGRLWDPDEHPPKPLGGNFDPDFTHAANALGRPSEQSNVVKSAFGYHIIRLEERYPEIRLPLEQRRTLLTDEIYARRAKQELDALMQRLHAAEPVSTERAVEALTGLVLTGP